MKNSLYSFGGAAALILLAAATASYAAPGDGGKRLSGGRVAAEWAKMDTDRDETISKAERLAAAQARFAELDVDGDGKIDTGDRDARVKQAFAKMDANGNGSVDEGEFITAQKARAEKRREGSARLGGQNRRGWGGGDVGRWSRADSDGDKAISRAEFEAATLARFSRADANGDGTLTKEEARAARGVIRDRRGQARRAG